MSLLSEHFGVNSDISVTIFKMFPADLMSFRKLSSLFGTNMIVICYTLIILRTSVYSNVKNTRHISCSQLPITLLDFTFATFPLIH